MDIPDDSERDLVDMNGVGGDSDSDRNGVGGDSDM